MLINNHNKGYVLLEIIIYVALFSIMIGGLIVSSFQLIKSGSLTGSRFVVQEEMNFVLKKIDWALTGASDINISSGVLKITNAGDTIAFKTNGTVMEFCKNTGSTCTVFTPLTTVNVKVTTFTPTLLTTTPEGITITLTIDGQTATFSKYLKI